MIRHLAPASLLLTLMLQPAHAEVVEYDNIVGTVTLISASGPTPDSPVQINLDGGGLWNMYCREDPVGSATSASAGLAIDTATGHVTITYDGETYDVPDPTVYTGVAGYGILVKAAASEDWFESTGPNVDTRYTNSASFTFNTTNIGREFTGIITEKQDYFRAGQIVGACVEKYRVTGRVPGAQPGEVAIIDWIKGWVRGALVDEDKSKNTRKTRYTTMGVRG